MNLPNFLIIGAAKSGTTSLANYCQQHPEIFISNPKEPNFFFCEDLPLPPDGGPASPEIIKQRLYHNSINNITAYQQLFAKAKPGQILGEASVRYLYYPRAAENIKKYLPTVKLVAILRNPIERLYSHYLMNIRHLLEPLSLEAALEQEPLRIKQDWGYDWHYLKVSMYSEQIKYYLDLFGPEQIQIILFDDLVEQPLQVMQELYKYLGVDSSFVPNFQIKLEGYYPKNLLIQRLIFTKNPVRSTLQKILPYRQYDQLFKLLKKINKGKAPELDPSTKKQLEQVFKADLEKLQGLIGREIPWLKTSEIAS